MTRRWIVSLVLHTSAVVFLVATVSFLLLQVIPGDPAAVVAGLDADPSTVAAVRAQMGLDRPWYTRYLDWIGGLLTGDLGESYVQRAPVASLVGQRLPVTASLAGCALVLALVSLRSSSSSSGRMRIAKLWQRLPR